MSLVLPFPTAQFTQTSQPGVQASGYNAFIRDGVILPTSTNSFYGGTAVKLVAPVSGEVNFPVYEKAAVTDAIAGIVKLNLNINPSTAGNTFGGGIEVFYGNSTIHMRTNAAITSGSKVEIVPQTGQADRVIAWGGTNTVIGVALQSASAANQIITIQLSNL